MMTDMKLYRILPICLAVLLVSCNRSVPEVEFTVGDSELSFDAAGGRKTVEITADGEWVASSGEPWITISPANGRGSGRCQVIIDSTLILDSRSGRVNIRRIDDDELVSISVSQAGFDYSISVDKDKIDIPEYDLLDKRYFDVKVKSNIAFDVKVPEDVSWITLDRSNKELELDRGVRPREVRIRFNWKVSSVPQERSAKIEFVPKDADAVLARQDFLTVVQGAAEEITQSRRGDSLAVLGISRGLGMWTEYDTSLPMNRWTGIRLWSADDIEAIRELVQTDREHLLLDKAALDDSDPNKALGDEEYLEAVADSYVGRVRSASFTMFTTRESVPQEIQHLRAAENITIYSNANAFLRSLSSGEHINNLTQLRRLTLGAYGLTELHSGITALKNLEYLNLSSNNFQAWPSVLTAENFPKLHAIVFNANQRRVVYDLSNTSAGDLGGFIDSTTPAMDNSNNFWRRLLTWEKLDTLVLSVNYIQGTVPDDNAVRAMGIANYTEADRGDSLTVDFLNLNVPRVLPNAKTFSINYNRLNGSLPMWILYHPKFDYWLPDSFIYNQEGSDKNGVRAGFDNVPVSLSNYGNVPGNAGSYYDIHPYKLEKDDDK